MSVANAQTDNQVKENLLSRRQLGLAECACLEAQGDMQRLDGAIRKALDEGVTVNELKEAFSQLYMPIQVSRVHSMLSTNLKVCSKIESHKELKITRASRGNVRHCGTMPKWL